MTETIYKVDELNHLAKELFKNERKIQRLDGWFLANETGEKVLQKRAAEPNVIRHAHALYEELATLPIYIDDNAVFAGTQRDAFAKSYALINPNFSVASFNGYCDPTAVFNDIEPNEIFSKARIEAVRDSKIRSTYVTELAKVYESAKEDTAEVAYFIEQVTGHLIPDLRVVLEKGIGAIKEEIKGKLEGEIDEAQKNQYQAMLITLDGTLLLSKRYSECARTLSEKAEGRRKAQLRLLANTLDRVPQKGAETLFEAIQSFLMLWQVMCLEQSPNPFAFSVGNADRIFEPYRAKEGLSREYAAGLFKHFLVFFNVGDRSWAISQNVIVGGRDVSGNDLSNETTYALLDAYYEMNLPQPILSVKLHKNTSDKFYEELGRFYFTPGALTPSFFNDDSLFAIFKLHGIAEEDLPDYSIAGCQEPLIMGKDNGNTTNSWLNLAKILELALNDGKSFLSDSQLGPKYVELAKNNATFALENIREIFEEYFKYYVERMVIHANGASRALSHLPVPFLSNFMGGVETGIDTRDPHRQGTKYNGSGCLIHGLTVVAESFVAIDCLLKERPQDATLLTSALKSDFEETPSLHDFLVKCPKFGNNEAVIDEEVRTLAIRVSELVRSSKNYLGNSFRPDFSSPSTHLIYGSLVGALPNGRKAKEMLNYGVDPLYGEAGNGLGFRVLSTGKLPFEQFEGGYASHLGLDPNYFKGSSYEEKGLEFKNKIIDTLFFRNIKNEYAPFYLYVNVTTPEILKKVLDNPKKYAPSGVYIMRIHGTFVNFLDLSPEIQVDIIKRLDLQSTSC